MDDILASIRKILNEDEPAGASAPAAAQAEAIQLTPEMMIAPPESLAGPAAPEPVMATPQPAQPQAAQPQPVPPEPAPPPMAEAPIPARVPTNIMQSLQAAPPEPPPPVAAPPSGTQSAPSAMLLDPLAAAAAAAALGQLSRAVAQERGASVTRSGPSIEDVVREELRPMLKAWLDAHLPATVERMVRTEIERVMAGQR